MNLFGVSVQIDEPSIPDLSQSHFIHGQSASFIRTNVVGAAHGFAGLHFSHKVVVIEHLLYRNG